MYSTRSKVFPIVQWILVEVVTSDNFEVHSNLCNAYFLDCLDTLNAIYGAEE